MLYQGKTLQEAIKNAAEQEFCSEEEIEYILKKETEDEVEIEVFTIMDVIAFAQKYLHDGIEALGFDNKVVPTLNEGVIKLRVESDRNAILIGKNGKSLQALNELTKIAVSSYYKKKYRILIDVGNYKIEKYDRVIRLARKTAHEVQKNKTEATLDYLTPDERRVIHNALNGMPHIKTESEGMGESRRLHIKYID